MAMTIIKIANAFSKEPAGRYRSDGQYSGQRFREELLVPALAQSDDSKVIVDLDDLEGYGSSFLEESFGGLIREAGYRSDDLHSRLEIQTSDKALIDEIWSYIDDASKNIVR